MDYLTETDKTVLFGVAAGLFGGLLNSAAEIALRWWNEEALIAQNELVARAIVRGVIYALFFGAGAFVLILYDAQTPLKKIDQYLFFFAVFIGLGEPLYNRAWDWLFGTNKV
ncbi:MAG: hypothetical protein AAF716_06900 [Cyanobacteria bacterium P01_D01_bin.1]